MCFSPTRGCLGHSHYSFVSKSVGKAGWKMSSTHIRHVLQTRIQWCSITLQWCSITFPLQWCSITLYVCNIFLIQKK